MNNRFDKLIELVDETKISFGEDYLSPIEKNIITKSNLKPKITIKNPKFQQSKIKLNNSNNATEKIVESIKINTDNKSKNNLSSISHQELNEKVLKCSLCPAANIRKNSIMFRGDLYPKVMVIGEGPGREEDSKNQLFVGPSGQYLEKWLNSIHINFNHDVYFTNVVKCYSHSNPTKEMVNACIPYLERQIEIVNPKTILILGKVAANALFENENTLKSMRGRVNFYKRIPTVVTYHPAAVLRNLNWRKAVWEDLQKLEKLINI